MVRHRTLVAALAVVGCGQAAAPVVYPSPEPLTVEAPQAEVWRAAIDVATEMKLPISTIDAGSGYLRTDPAYLPEPALGAWWDCDLGPPEWTAGGMPVWEREMLGRDSPGNDDADEKPGLAPLGTIAMAFLERSGTTQLRLLVSDVTYRPGGRECRSKGVFEGYFLSVVVERWRSLYHPQAQN